jgi:hypothetical protein
MKVWCDFGVLAFFLVYEIIWLFVFSCRTLCEMAVMGMK